MRRLAFPPETLNQFAGRWYILDEIGTEPSPQRALRYSTFPSEEGVPTIIPKDLASIGRGPENIALTGPLACGRTSGCIPHDESAVPQGAMRGVRPAILEASGQGRIFGMSRDNRLFVVGVSITFDGGHEAGAKHRCRRTGQQCLGYALSISNPAGSDQRYMPGFVQDFGRVSYNPRFAWT